MVIDFCALNEKTIGGAYPFPNITKISVPLRSAKYFIRHRVRISNRIWYTKNSLFHSALSFQSNAIRIKERTSHVPKTHGSHIIRIIKERYVCLSWRHCHLRVLVEHQTKFNKFFQRLEQTNLKLQSDKCEFLRKEVSYLGHVIDKDGNRIL